MDEKKEKRVLTIELDENVKKVSITGLGDDETVVMKEELSEEELDQATGGGGAQPPRKCPLFGGGCENFGCDIHTPGKCGAYRPQNNPSLCPNYTQGGCTVNF